jgi:hypothetical protein
MHCDGVSCLCMPGHGDKAGWAELLTKLNADRLNPTSPTNPASFGRSGGPHGAQIKHRLPIRCRIIHVVGGWTWNGRASNRQDVAARAFPGSAIVLFAEPTYKALLPPSNKKRGIRALKTGFFGMPSPSSTRDIQAVAGPVKVGVSIYSAWLPSRPTKRP